MINSELSHLHSCETCLIFCFQFWEIELCDQKQDSQWLSSSFSCSCMGVSLGLREARKLLREAVGVEDAGAVRPPPPYRPRSDPLPESSECGDGAVLLRSPNRFFFFFFPAVQTTRKLAMIPYGHNACPVRRHCGEIIWSTNHNHTSYAQHVVVTLHREKGVSKSHQYQNTTSPHLGGEGCPNLQSPCTAQTFAARTVRCQ